MNLLSLFRRKRNVRLSRGEREARLAVNVPRSRKELRLQRRRRTMRLMRWGGAGTAALVLLLYARSLWQQAFRSKAEFAVGHFEFHSNGGITARHAAAAAGLRSDMNLMEVDPAAIRSKLMALPRVKQVQVARRLPNKLSIEIQERLPVAWITSENNGIDQKHRLFVDREGVAFKCDELLREYMALPVINAADQPVITLGRAIASPAVSAALDLLEKLRTREWPVPCSTARVDIPNAWTLSAEMESGAVFTFRPEHLEKQLDRLDFIIARAHGAHRSVASVNLQMQRNVPVRFFDTATAGPEVRTLPVDSPRVQNAGFAPARGTAPARPPSPSPSRQDQDIQTILRGI